ncbi:hypothetical protein IRJ41_016594 [Triplophysa rosa]|uniref:Uncharacterized protein n=1 Tax=Triplophysa rosa TaxID=992332 RepID=A0A9W7T321_TRIRA|nr:hypothetical protein IRJ41_016594 [Triplophysa rosa]
MAEMEAKGLNMSSEQLHREQLIHLQVYHASCLVKDMQAKDFPPKLGTCEAENRCLAQELSVCVFQQILTKTMYPGVKKLKWIQCDLCSGWLHYDCAGINPAMVTEDMVFRCGCDIEKSYPFEKTLSVLNEEMVVNIMEDQEILDLHNGLKSGTIRSNRMFLHKHPTYSPKLKTQLDERISFFNERQVKRFCNEQIRYFC